MEKFKFRGKRTDNGEWVYGYYFKTPLTAENFDADSFQSGINRHCIASEHGVVYEVDPETVSLFTGLKDKRGNEWYRKDILVDASGVPCFIIDYDDDKAMFNGFYLNEDGSYDDGYEGNLGYLRSLGCTVGGNTFENPELLGGQKW